ncbi:MAG: ROK family protein [Frankiales bacterium]|nr:ROK family protein [Frankiales bacterium]
MTTVLALDVGGTKLAAGLVSADGSQLARHELPTPSGGAEEVWDAVVGVLDEVAGRAPYEAVGIGCGGPMRWPDGVVSPGNLPAWRDFPLLERVALRWGGGRPTAVHNDAVAVALAEHRWGAGRGSQHVMGVTVSTGVGAGLVLHGRRVDGASGNAGHLGHVVVEPDGDPCTCGGRGCLETVARGAALVARAERLGWHGPRTGRAVAEAAHAGDPACRAALRDAGRAVGVAVASAAALLDLEVVAVAGGVAESGPAFWEPLRAAFDEHAGWAFVRAARVVPAALGRDAALVGAGAIGLDALAR